MYAIVFTGGKQYKVEAGDVVAVEKLAGEPGDSVELEVIFLNDGGTITTDAKALADKKVVAEIVEQFKGEKQLVFKFKKRKGYKRLRGHRQELTRLRIVSVAGETVPVQAAEPEVEAEATEAAAE